MKKRRTTPRKKWSFQDIVDAYNEWSELVEDDADPVEALHGHVCGSGCWHEQSEGLRRDIERKLENK